MNASAVQTTPESLSEETIRSYRERGFVRIPGVISREEAARFREAALGLNAEAQLGAGQAVFDQFVNVWQHDKAMRDLTMHPNIAGIAEKLAGAPMRLWHDQVLIKKPHNNAATEPHQDQPYWPHRNSTHPLSAWIALCDVPPERGCMTFFTGSQRYTDLPAQDLNDSRSLYEICPDMQWMERVTLPLRAGDCTFHHALCAHMANPNTTDEPRVAHVVIYIDKDTIFDGRPHPVTEPLDLEKDQPLSDGLFPPVQDMVASMSR